MIWGFQMCHISPILPKKTGMRPEDIRKGKKKSAIEVEIARCNNGRWLSICP